MQRRERFKKHQAQLEHRETIIAVTVTLVACFVVNILGKPDKWMTAAGVTVALFSGMISYYWRLWRFGRFWFVTAALLLPHLLLIWLIFGAILRTREDVALVVCVPGIFVEGFFLYYAARVLLGESLRAIEDKTTLSKAKG